MCFKALGLEYEYRRLEQRGSWLANCAAKSEIVGEFLAAHPNRKCVYVDVDSIIIHKPQLFSR